MLYAVFLWATRAGVLDPEHWSLAACLARLSPALVADDRQLRRAGANFSGAPPGSTYVPAHIENGELVPGDGSK